MAAFPSSGSLDFRIALVTALRQFAPWLVMVLLVTIAGQPGVVCVTPMAWLIALRVGNLVAWRSKSETRSHRLTEAVLAGGFFGSLQGILFCVVVPLMGPIMDNEWSGALILAAFMLVGGMIAGAGLSTFTAYLNERKRMPL